MAHPTSSWSTPREAPYKFVLISSQEKHFLAEAIALITHIGEALHYTYQQNIVHRDLKPDNILFNAKEDALLDRFGLTAILIPMNVLSHQA